MNCWETCKDDSDPLTSDCKRDGHCLFGCVKAFWGPACSLNCPQTCIESDCDSYTGECLQGCEKRFWGDNCEKDCTTNCLEFDCHRFNATCKQGCINGYYGMNCAIRCPDHCLNNTCFKATGTCTRGCEADYTGDRCDTRKLYITHQCASKGKELLALWDHRGGVDVKVGQIVFCDKLSGLGVCI